MTRPSELAREIFIARVINQPVLTKGQLRKEAEYCLDAACAFTKYIQEIRALGDDTTTPDYHRRPGDA